MGYHTEFTGHIGVSPPLNADEMAYLKQFSETRRMDRGHGPYYVQGSGYKGQGQDRDIRDFNQPPEGQPGLWCQWVPSEAGTGIEWNGWEKFYESPEWMQYLIDHFLKPDALAKTQTVDGEKFFTFGDHALNGVIKAKGEERGDKWYLVVENNFVRVSKILPARMKVLRAPSLQLTHCK